MSFKDKIWYLHPRVMKNTIRYHWAGIKAERDIKPGDIYENCNYHPMICIENNRGDLTGVSLITGNVGGCSYFHCGPFKMTTEQVQESIKGFQVIKPVDYLKFLQTEPKTENSFNYRLRAWVDDKSEIARALNDMEEHNNE